MTKVEELVHQVATLSAAELATFRRWFGEFDAQTWDLQIEADIGEGKLDSLADAALRDHAEGKTSTL